jgi:transposase InsO family protein
VSSETEASKSDILDYIGISSKARSSSGGAGLFICAAAFTHGKARTMRRMRASHEGELSVSANDHDGTILTEAPDVLWGTDATLMQTFEEGRVWVFAAIDHFNSKVVGHHVSTDGSRFSVLEPISQAVTTRFGGIAADAARGVSLRLNNGPQYTSHHFSRQISHWGMALSYAFPHQPEGMASSSGSSESSRSRRSGAEPSAPPPRSGRQSVISLPATTPLGGWSSWAISARSTTGPDTSSRKALPHDPSRCSIEG